MSAGLAQGRGDGEAGGADGREEATEKSDGRGPDEGDEQQLGSDGEGESDLAEGLPVNGGGFEAIESEVGCGGADASADQGQGEGFKHDGEDHWAGAEAERAQGRDFAGTGGHGTVHRV